MKLRKPLTAGVLAGALLLSGCQNSSSPSDSSADASGSASAASSSEAPSSNASSAPAESSEGTSVETKTTIDADTHEIPATVVIPASASEDQPAPAVLLLHGTGSQKDEAGDGYVRLAEDLAEAGIASIRIDFMGSGESTAPDEDFDLENALSDSEAALDFLAEQAEIDASRLGVLGWSQGGLHALRVAADDDRITSLVTWAAPSEPMDVSEEQRQEAAEKGYFTEEFDWRDPMDTGQAWIDGMDSLDVASVVSSIDVPMLLINGADDDVVPPENADAIAENANDAEVLIIPNADHTFKVFTDDGTPFEQLSEATVKFFSDNLQ